MSVKELDARVQHKQDTQANWEANDPVLLDGELIFVDMTAGGTRQKLGDGTSKYSQLKFLDEEIYTELANKCDTSRAINVTLAAGSWSGGQQTVAVDGVTVDTNGIAGLPQNYSVAQYEAVIAAEILICGQGENEVTFAANGDVPQIDIPVVVILFG